MNPEKVAVQQALVEFRKAHALEDLEVMRKRLMEIIEGEDSKPGDIIKATQILSKMHGSTAMEKLPDPKPSQKEEKREDVALSADFVEKLKVFAGIEKAL